MSFGALPCLRCLRSIEYHQNVQLNIACRKTQTSATCQPCKEKHLGFRRCQSVRTIPCLIVCLLMIQVPHAFAGRAWKLIAAVLVQANQQLPPTAAQRSEASTLCWEITVSLKHTSPEVNATASLAAHMSGFSDLVSSNQRLIAQTEVLLHRGETQQQELEEAQGEILRLRSMVSDRGAGFPTPGKSCNLIPI